jgi:SAM-dependent methyltransferase
VSSPSYPGTELELFIHALNWKSYWSRIVRKYVRGSALEVGAGIGSNIPLLYDAADRWICLEPDPQLCKEMERRVSNGRYDRCAVVCGSIGDLAGGESFDAILYIDVLEHIQDDAGELRIASSRLKPGGNLIVLVPAYQWLFSPFDKAIGHHRRYDTKMLKACVPAGLRIQAIRYLDSVGFLASLANRLLLNQSLPTPRQVSVWDKFMVPGSRLLDPVFRFGFGKSVLMVLASPGS